MKRHSLAAASAAALLTAALAGGMAPAQTQLRDGVKDQLAQHNIVVNDFDTLSDAQVLQLQLVMNSTGSTDAHKTQIGRLLAESSDCVANDQMRAQVASELAQHGVAGVDVAKLTGTQVVVLEAVLNTSEPNAVVKAQIDKILGGVTPAVGNEQIRAEAASCVRRVNANVDLDAMTPDQLIRIQLIGGGTGSEAEKREMIEKLAN